MPVIEEEHTDAVFTRIDAVVTLILENDRYMQSKRNKELTDMVKTQFNVGERMAQLYIAGAKKEVRKIGADDKKKALNKAYLDREFLFNKAKGRKGTNGKFIEKPDYKFGLEVIKDRDKLQGLYVEQAEVTNKNYDMGKFTEKALERIKRGEPIDLVAADPTSIKADK